MKRIISVAALCVLGAACAFAQAGGVASISGTVHDPTGAVVANGKVVISSDSKGQLRTIKTNGAGTFTAPALIPGPGYHVTVTAAGFAPYDQTDVTLQVGQNLDLDINLVLSQSATQVVNISSAAELLDDQKTDVSQVITQAQIDNLPTNGRRVDSFVLLTPGVTNDGTFGLLSFRGVAGHNTFLLDGNDNTEQFYNENAGRTRIQSQLSQDAVQEFQVVSDNFSAEYGRAMGGVVNTITKSGSNEVHGSAFYYFRSTAFLARDTFSNFTPSERRVEGGASVGGPIIKNKLFYFLNFDLAHRNFPMSDSYVQPGVIDSVNHTWIGCQATAAQCAAINSLLPRFYGQVPRTYDNDLGFGKVDYRLNDRNTFVGEFNFMRWFSPNGIQSAVSATNGGGVNNNGDDSARVRNVKFGWTSVVTNSLVNVFRFGWDTDRQADDFNAASLGSGLGYLNVNVAGTFMGPPNYLPRVEPNETRHEYADDLSWTKGRHALKFGFNAATNEDYNYFIMNAFGTYTYLTATDFAEDYSGNTTGAKHWASYSQTFGNPVADYTIKEYSGYVQDQWKATDRLTLSLGVRWDKSTVPNFPVVNPDFPQTSHINSPSRNFSPRFGFAYRADNKTVIRGGYGIYYARMIGGLIDNLWTTNGLYQNPLSLTSTNATQLAAGPTFPNVLLAPPTGASVSATNIQFAAPNLKTPYSQQANIGFSRELPANMLLSASLIWSRGVNLYGVTDLNAVATTSYNYTIEDAAGNVTGAFNTPVYTTPRPNTKYNSIFEVTNGTNSYYNALAVTLEKRFSHGIQSLLSYTWSHEIDEGQGGGSNALFFSSLSSYTYNGNYGFERGSGLLDQRHRLVYSFVWTPAIAHPSNAFLKYVVDGWQISGITTIASGHPAGSPTIRIVSAPTLPSGSFLSTSTINGYGGNTRVPFLPVDAIYTPWSFHADMRLSKAIPLGTERVKLWLNGEAFNISNSWSPTAMFTQEYTATKGVLQATPTAAGFGSADTGFPDGTQARRLQVSARLMF